MQRVAIALACVLGGCAETARTETETATGASAEDTSGDAGTTDGPGSGPGATSDSQGETGSDDDSKFDVGAGLDTPPPGPTGCDRVDFLFVVDNSDSMADEQGSLAASFPAFVDGIETALPDLQSVHVGVTTTDEYAAQPIVCQELGALVTRTVGPNSSNQSCGPYGAGTSFMTEADDLETSFSCAAQVGSGGDGDERPMDAIRGALGPEMNDPGGCNEGFSREQALLVIVIITDEEDDHEMLGMFEIAGSDDDPPKWYADVIAAKSGYPNNVAVLSLLGLPKPNACPPFQWDGFDGAEIAPRLKAFTEMFTNGFVGDVCTPSYEDFFDASIGVVAEACDGFTPPG